MLGRTSIATRGSRRKVVGYVTLALFVGAFCLYKLAAVGVIPLVVVGVGGTAVDLWLWLGEGAPSRRELRQRVR